jgi:hypothetical protein
MEYITKNHTLKQFLSHYKPNRWIKIVKLLAIYGLHHLYQQGRGPGITENDILTLIANLTVSQTQQPPKQLTKDMDNTHIINTIQVMKKEITNLENIMKKRDHPPNENKSTQNIIEIPNSRSQSESNRAHSNQSTSNFRPAISMAYSNNDLVNQHKQLNPVMYQKEHKASHIQKQALIPVKESKEYINEVQYSKKPIEIRESIQDEVELDQQRNKDAKYYPMESKHASMMENVEGLLSSSLVNQFSNDANPDSMRHSERDNNKLIYTFKDPQPNTKHVKLQPVENEVITSESNRNQPLDRQCVSSIKSEEFGGSHRSENSSGSKYSGNKNQPPLIQEEDEESNNSQVVSSEEKQMSKKLNKETMKPVPVFSNDALLRRRTESMPQEDTNSEEEKKNCYV